MSKIYIGIDNGVSGSLGVIQEDNYMFVPMPTKSQQNYTKAKGNITRIDVLKLEELFNNYILCSTGPDQVMAILERPMVNPTRFKATTSALRSLEAVLIFLESKRIAFDYIDSKEWQRDLLSRGAEKEDLKRLSAEIGKRLFPLCEKEIDKQNDADGILIAEYCRRKFG